MSAKAAWVKSAELQCNTAISSLLLLVSPVTCTVKHSLKRRFWICYSLSSPQNGIWIQGSLSDFTSALGTAFPFSALFLFFWFFAPDCLTVVHSEKGWRTMKQNSQNKRRYSHCLLLQWLVRRPGRSNLANYLYTNNSPRTVIFIFGVNRSSYMFCPSFSLLIQGQGIDDSTSTLKTGWEVFRPTRGA